MKKVLKRIFCLSLPLFFLTLNSDREKLNALESSLQFSRPSWKIISGREGSNYAVGISIYDGTNTHVLGISYSDGEFKKENFSYHTEEGRIIVDSGIRF